MNTRIRHDKEIKDIKQWAKLYYSFMAGYCINAIGEWALDDLDCVFGEILPNEKLLTYKSMPTMGRVLKDAKITSISQARKNNWDFPLPLGYSEYLYGKKPPMGIVCWFPSSSMTTFILGDGHTPILDRI